MQNTTAWKALEYQAQVIVPQDTCKACDLINSLREYAEREKKYTDEFHSYTAELFFKLHEREICEITGLYYDRTL